MAVINAVEIARDFAGIAALALLALFGVLLWVGAVEVSAALGAGLAAVAAGALAAIAFYGVLGAGFGVGGRAIAIIGAVVVLMSGFLVAQLIGVRGFWIYSTLALGAVVGGGLIWLFSRGAPNAIGPLTPLLASAVLLFLVFGALGATKTALAAAPEDRRLRFTMADLVKPPAWFDCAYATLGGSGEAPGRCAFTPPKVEGDPAWASAPDAPAARDAALAPEQREALGVSVAAKAPDASAAPDPKDLTTPDFDTEPLETATASLEPDTPAGAAKLATDASEARQTASGEAQAASPAATAPPAAMNFKAGADAPPVQSAEAAGTRVGMPQVLAAATNRDAGPIAPGLTEATRSQFICFSALSASAERLCPDTELTSRDLEVAWRDKDGDAVAAAGAVQCYFDPRLSMQAVVLVNLSGALAEEMPSGTQDQGAIRRADAIYQMVTRLVGAARSSGKAGRDELHLSLYLAGGSPLRTPWAEQAFGPGRADRIFDIRSTTQTLGLMRFLRGELEALGPGALRGDLASSLNAAIEGMPPAPFKAGERIILLVTDSADTESLGRETALKLGAFAKSAGTPVFAIEIGSARSSAELKLLAESSGGALLMVDNAAALEAVADTMLRRARSFCAVEVSAPVSFFESGSLELKLKRSLDNSCQLEQVAVLDCRGLRTSERVVPSDL